jgi:hypothetical protein
MSNTIIMDEVPMVVATEGELLQFANDVRKAGGAAPLDALLPSLTGQKKECLLANALNFRSEVDHADCLAATTDEFLDRLRAFNCTGAEGTLWGMRTTVEIATTIAEKMDLTWVPGMGGTGVVLLPEHIGNAAYAFDEGHAFQEYATDRDY